MNQNLLALSFAVLLVPAARAASPGFDAGQTLDPRAALAAAGRPDGASTAIFLKKLGDATFTGSGGSLDAAGVASSIVESRVIVRQKTVDGLPGATVRLYRRAALASNPDHVEALADELTFAVRGDSVILKRDGRADEILRLHDGSGENGLSFTYVKLQVRWHPAVLETLSLALEGNRLTVTREEGVAGGPQARESFGASR